MDIVTIQGYVITAFNYFSTIVTLCSVIAVITPTKKDNTFIAKYMLPIVNAMALNLGNAKNQR